MATRRISALGVTRVAGALALLVAGGIHLEQYTAGHFSVVPTIGELFLVNFISATLLGLWLLAPVPRAHRRTLLLADCVVAAAGLGVAGGALIALLISETQPLFGFMENGYRLEAVIALASEAATIVLLGAFLTRAWARLRELQQGDPAPARSAVQPIRGRRHSTPSL
jgi:hypothetical protein